ncbi:MAG: hypothetical protein ACK5BV_07915 [Bacteroidota bacterium]
MDYIIFIFYLLISIWLVNKISFFKKSRLTPFWLTTFFTVKVIAGIVYGIFHSKIPNYQHTADTWVFFYNSLPQTNMLMHDPLNFFSEIFFNPDHKKFDHLFSGNDSYWNDLRHLYMIKIVAIMNIFSGSRYYVNVIFYSLLTFVGPIAFIRLMRDIFKGKLAIIAATTFMIPSFLFWTSGIHKDGIVFAALCSIAYLLHFNILRKAYTRKHILLLILFMLCIFPVRNYVVLASIPAITAWWWSAQLQRYKWAPFLIIGFVGSIVFFTTKYVYPKIDLPTSIIMRNKEFIKLGGNSMLPQPQLESNFKSFIYNVPNALNHTLARPYLNEVKSFTYFLSAIEIISLWLILFIWFFRFTDNPYRHEAVLFFMMLSIILLLLTGYIVPQLGAIVRYRSIYLPFLIVPIMCTIRWRKTY